MDNQSLREFANMTSGAKFEYAKMQVRLLRQKIRQAKIRYRRAKANNQESIQYLYWLEVTQNVHILVMFKLYIKKQERIMAMNQ